MANKNVPIWKRIDWQEVHWPNTLFLFITPLLAVTVVPVYLYYTGVSWGLLALFCACYMISNMSITCGYHRYFAHRSYQAHRLVELAYIFLAAGAWQGTLLEWCTDHRQHHRGVDSEADPYNIKNGFWYAHIGWMLLKEDPKSPTFGKFAQDLEKDPVIKFQYDYYVFVASFMGFIVPGLIAWACGIGFIKGVLVGGVLRTVLTQHSTFFINSLCHTIGRQPYNDKNTARDSLLMAVLTFGEGYHNYHHHFQADYRNGIKWYHWDPTKWWIKTLALFGLASKLKKVSATEILKARLSMQERLLISRGACADKVCELKKSIEERQLRLKQLREEYNQLRKTLSANFRSSSIERYQQLKRDLKIARQEFKDAYSQWMLYARTFEVAYSV